MNSVAAAVSETQETANKIGYAQRSCIEKKLPYSRDVRWRKKAIDAVVMRRQAQLASLLLDCVRIPNHLKCLL